MAGGGHRRWEKLGVEVTAVTVALEEAGLELEGHCRRERLLDLYQRLRKKQHTCQW